MLMLIKEQRETSYMTQIYDQQVAKSDKGRRAI